VDGPRRLIGGDNLMTERIFCLLTIWSVFRCDGQQPGNFTVLVRSQVQQVRGQHIGPHQQGTEEKLRSGQRAPANAHADDY